MNFYFYTPSDIILSQLFLASFLYLRFFLLQFFNVGVILTLEKFQE